MGSGGDMKPRPKDGEKPAEYLKRQGWTHVSGKGVWAWKQAGLPALFKQVDAVTVQEGLDRDRKALKTKGDGVVTKDSLTK
jgi:hypothetical protein